MAAPPGMAPDEGRFGCAGPPGEGDAPPVDVAALFRPAAIELEPMSEGIPPVLGPVSTYADPALSSLESSDDV